MDFLRNVYQFKVKLWEALINMFLKFMMYWLEDLEIVDKLGILVWVDSLTYLDKWLSWDVKKLKV